MPADTPVTNPVPVPTVAVPVLLLLHVPPAVMLDSVTVAPALRAAVPVMAAGDGFVVNASVLEQPLVSLYVMVVAPAASADTLPLLVFTDAIVGALLVHVPPVTAFESVQALPVQMDDGPLMAAGVWLTVITALVKQPVAGIL